MQAVHLLGWMLQYTPVRGKQSWQHCTRERWLARSCTGLGGKVPKPTAPENGLPGIYFWTASVPSGGVGTLRCFDPSQGCSVILGPPAQHDRYGAIGCFM